MAVKNYNDLIPPSNPDFPPDQLLCYYCNQPISETVPVAGYRNRIVYMAGRWLHKNGEYYCSPEHIRTDIDKPRCHVCRTQTKKHMIICSMAGEPRFKAKPFSEKEEELIDLFGWNPKGKHAKEKAKEV